MQDTWVRQKLRADPAFRTTFIEEIVGSLRMAGVNVTIEEAERSLMEMMTLPPVRIDF